ncbi:LytTR family transcriptional regulator [Lentibacter algarum]|uniref:LytTR family DNA-binding domain-containing protein n=1 Tax=Lentibacter algarum TaxID=576131 RepID=UPI001C07497F|nr:LytTR family DNA-binding domain-containing protein [Lentibacter algarum]MBU2980855.1 LytTR family transcriptional regulator [Lentibacter algarum]
MSWLGIGRENGLRQAEPSVSRACGEMLGNYVNTSPSHYALRETRRYFTETRFVVGLAAVALLLAVSGPFGTHTSMSFAPRLAYWAFTAPLTFALGGYVSAYMSERFRNATPVWLAPLTAAVGTAVSVTLLVVLLNWLAFGLAPTDPAYITGLAFSVFVTAAIIALALHYTSNHASADTADDSATAPPALLQRLELAKRGALVSLAVQDHYVEVITTKGASLLLMRLSDAIKETGRNTGMQVHRSHWVAFAQISNVTREGDKARIALKDGRDIPASRSYIPALKQAGLLPQ